MPKKDRLTMSIGLVADKTYMLLRNMGIEKVRIAQKMPMELMEQVLGKMGL